MIFFSPSRLGFFHADLGTVPDDARPVSEARHAELLTGQAGGQRIVADAAGDPLLVDPVPATLAARLESAVRERLEAAARAAGYDSIASAVSYADEPAVLRYRREGRALRQWRSLMWDAAYDWLQQHPQGDLAAMLAQLPAPPDLNALED